MALGARDSARLRRPYLDAVLRGDGQELLGRDEQRGVPSEHPRVALGLSTRGALALLRAARVHAGLRGVDFVAPDDVQAVARWVLAHRLVLKPEAALDGDTDLGVVGAILEATAVPR